LLDSFNAPHKVCSCKCSFSCSPQLDHLSQIRKCVLRWEVTHVALLVVGLATEADLAAQGNKL
jgi:hypothetical protein